MTTGFNGDTVASQIIPQLTTIAPGENLSSLSSRLFNGDWERFPELLALNPNLDVFADLKTGDPITVPSTDQVFNFASNALDGITAGIGQLPDLPILSGYAPRALAIVGEINKSLGQAESLYKKVASTVSGRDYSGASVSLVQWLLAGK